MSGVYDDWERLIGATLRREQLRLCAQRSFSGLSLAPSSSFNSRGSSRQLSSFNLPEGEAFNDKQIPRAPNYLKIFTFAELKSATRNFSRHRLVAKGAFRRVFKGWVDEKTYAPLRVGVGIAGAVKLFNPQSEQDQPDKGAAVPKFGQWDANDPRSAESYTPIFNKVREERQTDSSNAPGAKSDSSYYNM